MAIIPIVTQPYPDETLLSWCLRLAKINEVSPRLFVASYFGEEAVPKAKAIYPDLRRGFVNFCHSLNVDENFGNLYLSLSTLSFESLALSPSMQSKIVNMIFRPESGLNTGCNYFYKNFYLCPECLKEDIENHGEAYIHRSHQLSNVQYCYKHCCSLYIVDRTKDLEYDLNKNILTKQVTEVPPSIDDLNYAKYSQLLLTMKVQSNVNYIYNLIFETLKQNNMSDESIYKKYFSKNVAKFLNREKASYRWINGTLSLPIKEMVLVLIQLFPDVNKFKALLPEWHIILQKHCNDCNQIFYTTSYLEKTGWGCTFCDSKISDEELFERIVDIGGDHEYIVKEKFNGLSQKINLYHKKCKKDFLVEPRDFLYLTTRCSCNIFLSRDVAEKQMKPFKNFKLIEFSGSSLPAKIYHKGCNQVFEKTAFRDFIETPKCPLCEQIQKTTPEIFKQKVVDLVGDEYEVLSNITNLESMVQIKHSRCGNIQLYEGNDFLTGSRCNHCTSNARKLKIERLLFEYAGNRYSIVERNSHYYILHDAVTNKEIKIRPAHIIQEIVRPTPSEVLPTDHQATRKNYSTWDMWIQLCKEYYEEFGTLRPIKNEHYKGRCIGDWCSTTRTAFNRGQLTKCQIEDLKSVGFCFNPILDSWEERFNEYKEYVIATGDYNPQEKVIYNGNKVGKWVRNQRHEYANGKLNIIYEQKLLEFNPNIFKPRKRCRGKF